MINRLLILCAVAVLSFACNPSDKPESNAIYPKGKKCKPASKHDIYEIDMSKAEEIDLQELVDFSKEIRIVPLEVSAANVFGELTKLLVYKDIFMVSDLNVANRIVAFDKEGKYLFMIDDEGKAPHQYQKIWDVQVNKNDETIQIWDLPQQKMISYDLQGEQVDSKRVDLRAMTFFPSIGKDWYVYHLDGRKHLGEKTPLLHYSDLTGGEIINKGAYESGIVDTWFDKNEFDDYDNSVYFHRAMSDTIYWIGPVNGQICPTYIIDFGDDRMPESAKQETEMLEMANIIKRSEASFSLGNLIVGRSYLHFMWTSERNQQTYHHLVDRFNYRSYQVSAGDLALFNIPIKKLLSADKNEFIGYNYLGDVDTSVLQRLSKQEDISDPLRQDITKLLSLEDPNTPLLFHFSFKDTGPESLR